MKNTHNKMGCPSYTVKAVKKNSEFADGYKLTLQATIHLLKVFTLFYILFCGIYNATAQTKTRVTGTANWNTASTWIQLRTGTAAFTNASVTVTGAGTLFLTELQAGDILMMNTTPGTVRGTVASVQSNTSLTLTVAALTTIGNATYGRQSVPESADNVQIGNTSLTSGVSVTLDVASATVASLTFIADNYSNSLTHAASNNLDVTGSATINQPTANNLITAWNINSGSATVSGLVSFPGANNSNRKEILSITSGTFNANGGITFSSIGTVANKLIDMSGGAGILNLKGALTTPNNATLNAGTSESIFNYADNVSEQQLNFFGAGGYCNLHLNNTNIDGAILSADITTANVTGNLRILSGIMNNGGFAIALNNTKTFEVANGAKFNIKSTSGMVTGTGITKTFGISGTVNYSGTAQTVSLENYGNLILGNTSVKTMPSSPLLVSGNFTMLGTASANALNAITIAGAVTLNSGSTFTAGTFTHNVAGNWSNNGGNFIPGTSTVVFNGTGAQIITGTTASQTFYNVTLAKASGSTLSTTGSTTTLTVQDFAQITGDFISPDILNINGVRTIASGVFNAGAITNVTGDWTNNAGIFNPGSGTVIFNGTTAQSITGATTFYSFTLNNTKDANAVTLNSSITVNGVFRLIDGHLITTASSILILGDAAIVILNGSPQDSSFVKGPMIQTVATTSEITKTFPVGNGTMMHQADLTVTHSTSTSTQYTGEYFPNSATALGYTLPGTLTKVSDIGYWDISKETGASVAAALVRLYYLVSDVVSDSLNLRIAKDDGAGTWVDVGGIGTTIPDGTITSTNNFTSFSKFTLANALGGENILPIELLSFNAHLIELIVDLTWKTASESNNDYFIVEKSPDGLNFETIAIIDAAVNSTQVLSYSARDNNPYSGISYYRLKQKDLGGAVFYSDIIYVEISTENIFDVIVFPNPTADDINISIAGTYGKEELVHVTDILGKECYSKVITMKSDNYTFTIMGQSLAPGAYLVTVSDNENYCSKKVIIY